MYPFIKPLPVRDKQSDSFTSIDYETPLVSRDDKDNENMTYGKTGKNNEPNNHGDPN